jgi:hypothetical protein
MAHDQEIVGLNLDTVYWMDASVANYYINKHKQKKTKIKDTTKKTIKKK